MACGFDCAGYRRDVASRRPDRLTTTLAAALAAAAFALGGCGGAGSHQAAHNAITRPELIAKVDAICKEVARRSKPSFRTLQALVDASGTYKSRLIKAAPTLRTVYKLQASKLRRFEALDPPTADRAQIAEITRSARETLKERVDRLGTTYGFRADCFSLPLDLSAIQ